MGSQRRIKVKIIDGDSIVSIPAMPVLFAYYIAKVGSSLGVKYISKSEKGEKLKKLHSPLKNISRLDMIKIINAMPEEPFDIVNIQSGEKEQVIITII